ncbi:hypothetical protein [Streptomyces sp. NPDC001770]
MSTPAPRSPAPRPSRAAAGLTTLAVVLLLCGASVQLTGNLLGSPTTKPGGAPHPPSTVEPTPTHPTRPPSPPAPAPTSPSAAPSTSASAAPYDPGATATTATPTPTASAAPAPTATDGPYCAGEPEPGLWPCGTSAHRASGTGARPAPSDTDQQSP